MKKIYLIFSIFIIFISFLIGVFIWAEIYLPKNFQLGEEKLFLVKKGQSVFQIAGNLEKDGLIKNKFFFNFYALLQGGEKKLQAGEYLFSPSMALSEIAKKIISGDIAKFVVTIPEGFTVKQIEEKLNLKLSGENLEGFLFPDTYQFPLRVSGEEVLKKMRDNFEKKTANLKITREIVIMASLLEKEVRTVEDKKLVSGILWKRLEIGMPLQVDADKWTYENRGLPKSPISNPGLESIRAAIEPENSDYWYYLSTPEGETIFSKTLEEHNIAKAKYLKGY